MRVGTWHGGTAGIDARTRTAPEAAGLLDALKDSPMVRQAPKESFQQ